ncbi:hypothetical protein ACF07U_00035 [Streptomyces californicus]|uniref:hypothetical protein n=1 Tax=Streptomyces californicus TaxID=67351 RepID=UPI003702C4EF
MNDSPGWASPGSAASDGKEAAVPRPSDPQDGSGRAGQWSSEQPPPGQWSPPSDSGGRGARPPAPGRGGEPHQGWAAPPPAAKPGIIPLRPLSLGEILDGSVSALRAHWRTALGFSLGIAVVTQIALTLMQRYLLPKPTSVDPNATGTEALRQASDSARSTLVSMTPVAFLTMIGTLFTAAVVAVVVSRSVLGRTTTLSDTWAEVRPRLLPLSGLALLLPLAIVAAMAVCIGPGLLLGSGAGAALALLGSLAACVLVPWLWVSFSLSAPALVLERQGVVAALRRSVKLVRGAWWRTFGVLVLSQLIILLMSMIVSVPFAAIAVIADGTSLSELLEGGGTASGWPFLIVTGIGDVIISTLVYPFFGGVTALLYVDQRIRREALDLDLARAAGLPGYGENHRS